MKRHLTAAKSSHRGRGERGTEARRREPPAAGPAPAGPQEPDGEPAAVTLRSVRLRTHTLKLTGELHLRSGHRSSRRSSSASTRTGSRASRSISASSATSTRSAWRSIAFRCGLASRRGYGLSVIAGSRFVHRALEQAGVADLAAFEGENERHRARRDAVHERRAGHREGHTQKAPQAPTESFADRTPGSPEPRSGRRVRRAG